MMKLMTLNQYRKMSKTALIRKITKALRAMSKKRLAVLCYNITKSKLPRLSPIKLQKALGTSTWTRTPSGELIRHRPKKRKTKRKFSRKQLAAQRLFAKRARAGTLRKRKR